MSLPEIDAVEQHVKLVVSYLTGGVLICRPWETILFQPLQPETKSSTIPVEDFQQSSLLITEQKQGTGKGVPIQVFFYQDGQPI